MARESYLLPSGFSALSASHPVLTGEESLDWEKSLLDGSKAEWAAMRKVGRLLGIGILREYRMSRYDPNPRSIVSLVGKGHNAGDALLSLLEIDGLVGLERVCIVFACSESELRQNTGKALRLLKEQLSPENLEMIFLGSKADRWLDRISERLEESTFDIAIDGLFGMQFRPPLREPAKNAINLFNDASKIRLRVAVDTPSGIGDESDEDAFRADATFATGICKAGVADPKNQRITGYIRYLDIGFFDESPSTMTRVLTSRILDPLRELRYFASDKRSYGHLFVMAGSAQMPGALAMCVASAINSGVGLVTVFAPERHVPALACRLPEAMWVPWPETPNGGLSLEGMHLLRERIRNADAMVIGPGMGNERETILMIREAVSNLDGPMLLDADALRTEVFDSVKRRSGRTVLTPHLGEYARVFGEQGGDEIPHAEVRKAAESFGGVIVLKGHNMRIVDPSTVVVNTSGNAVLSRGGSGDILSGLIGGLLAMMPQNPYEAACMGAHWHGVASDLLAYSKGQNAARTTDLMDFLSDALKEESIGR